MNKKKKLLTRLVSFALTIRLTALNLPIREVASATNSTLQSAR